MLLASYCYERLNMDSALAPAAVSAELAALLMIALPTICGFWKGGEGGWCPSANA